METTARALLEAAALAAAMRRVEIWNPLLRLDAAADRAWASAGSGERGDWRTDPGRQATGFRLAVDLRQAAIWLGDGAWFGV